MSRPPHVRVCANHDKDVREIIPFSKCVLDILAELYPCEDTSRVQIGYDVNTTSLLIQPKKDGYVLEHSPQCPVHHQPTHINKQDMLAANREVVAVGVAVVVQNKKKEVLLTRRPEFMRTFPGMWVLPGGGVDAKETLEDAAIREVFEETGLRISTECLSVAGVWESCYPTHASLGPTVGHHLVVYMIAKGECQLDDLVIQSHEVDMAGWFDRKAITAIVQRNASDMLVPVRRLSGYATYQQALNNPDAPHTDEITTHSLAILTQNLKKDDVTSKTSMFDRVSQGTSFAMRLSLESEDL
eukprot:CFRG4591T1